MSLPDITSPEPKRNLFTRFVELRRGPWEWLATIIIAIGVVMLMQSFSLALYGWSFITIIVGTAMFTIVSHFRE